MKTTSNAFNVIQLKPALAVLGISCCLTMSACMPRYANTSTKVSTFGLQPLPGLQQSPNASRQWEKMADDLAEHTKQALAQHHALDTPITLKPPAVGSDFIKAFNNFLITNLVNKGIRISYLEHNPIKLNYDFQLINYDEHDSEDDDEVPKPHEVILSASLTEAGRYLMRTSDIYLVDQKLAGLYKTGPLPAVALELPLKPVIIDECTPANKYC